MTTLQSVIQKVLSLPREKQRQVLAYADEIGGSRQEPRHKPLANPEGLTADVTADLSLADFQESRRKLWGSASDQEL